MFTNDYYRNLPTYAPWERFPLPLLLDEAGRCLAQLPHLFPADPPEVLEVRPGRWRKGLPQEIQLHVRSPAQGGGYRLPTLRWDAKARVYRADSAKGNGGSLDGLRIACQAQAGSSGNTGRRTFLNGNNA